MLAIVSTTTITQSSYDETYVCSFGRDDAHRESQELFKLTGQLAQPNQEAVFSKRAAFFKTLKSKVGHIMAKASALRVNMNLAPAVPSTSRSRTHTSHAPLLYALHLSHHVLPPCSA